MKNWFVVRTKRLAEWDAERRIKAQGFDTFLPILEQVMVIHKRRIVGTVAMFPSFLLTQFDRDEDNWRPICNTRGVIDIVRALDPGDGYMKPLAMRQIWVDRIREASGQPDAAIRAVRALEKDDAVKIEEGPFTGLKGLFWAREADRIKVLLDILGKSHALSFPESAVSAA